MISIIAAVSNNQVIGINNMLPWYLPRDLKRFRTITAGRTIVMGRRTWESLPGPLSNRKNVVLSSDPNYKATGAIVYTSFEEVKRIYEEVFVIGGRSLYALALPLVQNLFLTLVHDKFEGDTYFPPWRLISRWQLVDINYHPADGENKYPMTFLDLVRI